MDLAVESVGVDGVAHDHRRRGRVADVGAVVDVAGAGPEGDRPDGGARRQVTRHQVTAPGGDDDEILGAAGRRHRVGDDRCSVGDAGQRHLPLLLELVHVGQRERGLERVVAAVQGVAAELQPRRHAAGEQQGAHDDDEQARGAQTGHGGGVACRSVGRYGAIEPSGRWADDGPWRIGEALGSPVRPMAGRRACDDAPMPELVACRSVREPLAAGSRGRAAARRRARRHLPRARLGPQP